MTAEKQKPPDHAGGSVEIVPSPPPKIDLRDAHAIRRELGSVYRDMRAGRLPTQDGTRLAYVLDLLRRAVETGTLQDRIEQIERHFNTGDHHHAQH